MFAGPTVRSAEPQRKWRRSVLVATLAMAGSSACNGSAAVEGDPASSDVIASASASGSATSLATVGAVAPLGFERGMATVTTADGSTCDVCLWLATTGDQRSQGLMHVTDIGPADGMAFVYPEPHTGTFWMKDTLLPISIVFFDTDGVYLSAFDMEPCTSEPCPTYPTARGFLVAVEVPQGELESLDIVPGSVLTLGDFPCET